MILRPSTEAYTEIKQITKNNAQFMAWLQSCVSQEVESLPKVLSNTAVAQGRCQVLMELWQVLDKARINK